MQEAPGGAKRIKMDARRGRESIITVGDVQIVIVPVSRRGAQAWQVTIPATATIEHRKAKP